ncbi:HAMP domain-containing sensor histidine kinase [Pseudoduganella sp. LjRoot289]|uniref:sensor histidine kinase n=1 Tax=Pseudoduganella sp. LjRoot289 TaxID=3342314 RepID=UPI003ECE8A1E
MSSNLTGSTDPCAPGMAPATRAVMACRDQVVLAWMDTMRAVVPRAGPLHTAILGNTLPAILETLALLLTESEKDRAVSDLTVLASEHGGERARLTPYDITTLIHELQLFKQVLFAELDKAAVALTPEQHTTIATAIDNMMRDSANAFSAVQAALREQFVASITHDLRTPLSNALFAAELIERMAPNDDIRLLAQTILRSAQRIDGMTGELLDRIVFGGGGKLGLHIARFDMVELVREVADSLNAGRHVELVLQEAQPPLPGYWCRESLRRALENLIDNALKYGKPGAPVTLALTSSFERVQLAVHNDGKPIPPEECESIFQLYRRAARKKDGVRGWGVGLPFARKVAEAHGGSLMVSSTEHDGTTFVIDVPLDTRPHHGAPSAA